ncbi:MAG: porin, partial [Methyloceanibacter sp.]
MDMFGGLTKTSSRIAIAAAFGMFGAYAMSTPANAADFGGDCCADLEERVAELEATTVRKGNKKV